MKNIHLPKSTLDNLKRTYEALMSDALPLDFAKTSALVQAAGVVVAVYDNVSASNKPTCPRVVKIAGKRYVKMDAAG